MSRQRENYSPLVMGGDYLAFKVQSLPLLQFGGDTAVIAYVILERFYLAVNIRHVTGLVVAISQQIIICNK